MQEYILASILLTLGVFFTIGIQASYESCSRAARAFRYIAFFGFGITLLVAFWVTHHL